MVDYVRYLKSKRSVDDRAINDAVMDAFLESLRHSPTDAPRESLRVLEVGAGIGAMVVRLAQRGAFSSASVVEYHLVDVKREVLVKSRALIAHELGVRDSSSLSDEESPVLRNSAIDASSSVHLASSTEDDAIESEKDTQDSSGRLYEILPPLSCVQLPGGGQLNCTFEVGDGLAHADYMSNTYDAVVASAVLDLFDVFESSAKLLGCLKREPASPRAFLFTLTFDGVTCFLPPRAGDAAVEARFHEAMGVDSRHSPKATSGRRLLEAISTCGAENIVAGSSTWVVHPERGNYVGDEQYFLECILDYVSRSASRVEDQNKEAKGWMEERLRQLKDGSLSYVAHNMDYFGQVVK